MTDSLLCIQFNKQKWVAQHNDTNSSHNAGYGGQYSRCLKIYWISFLYFPIHTKNPSFSSIPSIPSIPHQTNTLLLTLSYYKIRMKSKEYDHLYKFVMVGNSAVGKSSLLLRFADDDFNENYMITIGVDFRFKSLNINNRIVKLQIWDTAGQERFRTIVNTYYKNSHAVFLIFDLGVRDSFQDIKNYWINEVESYTDSNALLVLVGNKADVAERQVTQEEVSQFVTDKNLLYFETSAKLGSQVKEMFLGVATKLTERAPKMDQVEKKKRGTTLESTVEAQSQANWKNCYC